jgi:hypothetical protein
MWKGGTRATSGFTYGCFWLDGRTVSAHRIAWELANGRPIPDGLQIRHVCDTPLCVNPRHLLVGSAADNAADREEHGKSTRKGTDHHNARLDADTITMMRGLRLMGWSWYQIAERFGVSRTTASRAASGENWKHLGPAPKMPANVPGRRHQRWSRTNG